MQDTSALARLNVSVSYVPLAFIYSLFTPTITINGQKMKRPWGTSSFDIPAGETEVTISYPWLFAPECGKNSVRLNLQAGEIKTVSYRAGLIRYLPGKISVS